MLNNELKTIEENAVKDINEIKNNKILIEVKNKYLSKKSPLTQMLKSLGQYSKDERKEIGKTVNLVKQKIVGLLEEKRKKIEQEDFERKLEKEKIDVSLSGYPFTTGKMHPLRKTLIEIENIFLGLGFNIAEGPEIENDYYNFEALNIPAHHPARDMHDTFYVNEDTLLRTHTSPVQIRVMEKTKPPIKIIVPGKVYRRDSDVSHIPMFHQIEGLWVDENISFANLKYILKKLMQEFFEKNLDLRFRPSYFPFTEPSTEVDITCVVCDGEGCRVCKGTGWIEVLGAGMVHPKVFESVKYDTEKYQGFAFGVGVDRLAMIKYGINDIRLFMDNDIRFLSQF